MRPRGGAGLWGGRGPWASGLLAGSLTLPLQVASAPLQMPQQPVGAGVEQEGLLLVDCLGLLRPLDTDGLGLRPVPIPGAHLGVKYHELLAIQGKLGHRHRDIVRAQLAAQQALQGVGTWDAQTQMSRAQEQGPWSPPPSDPGSRPPAPLPSNPGSRPQHHPSSDSGVPVSPPSPKTWRASRKSFSLFLRSVVSFSQYQDTWLSQTQAP